MKRSERETNRLQTRFVNQHRMEGNRHLVTNRHIYDVVRSVFFFLFLSLSLCLYLFSLMHKHIYDLLRIMDSFEMFPRVVHIPFTEWITNVVYFCLLFFAPSRRIRLHALDKCKCWKWKSFVYVYDYIILFFFYFFFFLRFCFCW